MWMVSVFLGVVFLWFVFCVCSCKIVIKKVFMISVFKEKKCFIVLKSVVFLLRLVICRRGRNWLGLGV